MGEAMYIDNLCEQTLSWQQQLATSFTKPEALLKFLGLRLDCLGEPNKGSEQFPFKVTRSFASRMAKGDPDDPLLRQVFPLVDELDSPQSFSKNPVGDLEALVSPGVLHKYQGRVLLITTAACAINCRYCFRREFPYNDAVLRPSDEHSGLHYIANNRDVNEVILSGGDPLLLQDSKLDHLIRKIAAISHITRLRIHTRLPIVLPSRITSELIQSLTETRLQTVLVIHSNHPNELNREVASAIAELHGASIPLFNQSVLLKGVNDLAETLIDLSEALFSLRIIPYYLHLLDKTKGTSHFDIPINEAKAIQKELRQQLPGYLVPRMVWEKQGEAYKLPL